MLKKIMKASIVFVLVGTLFFLFPPRFSKASATDSANTTFQVNVQEVLSVSITTPTSWAKGDINTFLRNKVELDVTSNHIDGFTASMISTDANAELHHSSKTGVVISPIGDNITYTCTDNVTCPEFEENEWGFAIDDGTNANVYGPVAKANTAPNTLISRTDSIGSNNQSPITSRDIYFGSKSDITQASGTYSGTVVFYVVSGIINENTNPNPPTNPATPGDDTVANDNAGTYNPTHDRTVTTTTTTSTVNNVTRETTTTTINDGNVAPQGVTNSTSSNIYDGSMLTTGLAITASVAAASGLTFFILAKRKKDDDEEETE